MSNLTNMSIPSGERLADKLAVVVLDFRQWTGARVLEHEDFHLGVGGELPPENVIHDLGSKRICDPEHLKVFAMHKRRAERLLNNHGVPFMGGMAIPLDKSKQVLSALNDIANDFNRARDEFIVDYDRKLEAWLVENNAFATQLRNAVMSKQDVEKRINARFFVFKVSQLKSEDGAVDSFSQSEASLGDTLLDEIAKEATALYLRSFVGREWVFVKTLEKLRKWRERMLGLCFLNNRIKPVIDDVDAVLAMMPTSGRIEGELFYRLCTVVLYLSNPAQAKSLCTFLQEKAALHHNSTVESFDLDLGVDASPAPVSQQTTQVASSTETMVAETTANASTPVSIPVTHSSSGVNLEERNEMLDLEAEMDAFEAFLFNESETRKTDKVPEESLPEQEAEEKTVDETVLQPPSVAPSISKAAKLGWF